MHATYHEGNNSVADLDGAVPRREEVLEDRDDALAEFRGETFEDQVRCSRVSRRAVVAARVAYGRIPTRCHARRWVCRSGGRRCGARRKRWGPTRGLATGKQACRCACLRGAGGRRSRPWAYRGARGPAPRRRARSTLRCPRGFPGRGFRGSVVCLWAAVI
jgi:hypothetical protein